MSRNGTHHFQAEDSKASSRFVMLCFPSATRLALLPIYHSIVLVPEWRWPGAVLLSAYQRVKASAQKVLAVWAIEVLELFVTAVKPSLHTDIALSFGKEGRWVLRMAITYQQDHWWQHQPRSTRVMCTLLIVSIFPSPWHCSQQPLFSPSPTL